MRFSFANGENKRREAILPPAETAFLSRATFSPLLRALFSRGSSRKAWNFEQRTSCAWSSCTWRYSSSPQSSACSVSSDFFRSEKSERVIYNTAPRSCQGAFARFRCFLWNSGFGQRKMSGSGLGCREQLLLCSPIRLHVGCLLPLVPFPVAANTHWIFYRCVDKFYFIAR